jgi:hypothetical protein
MAWFGSPLLPRATCLRLPKSAPYVCEGFMDIELEQECSKTRLSRLPIIGIGCGWYNSFGGAKNTRYIISVPLVR